MDCGGRIARAGRIALLLAAALLWGAAVVPAVFAAKPKGLQLVTYPTNYGDFPYLIGRDIALDPANPLGEMNKYADLGEELELTLGLENLDKKDIPMVKVDLQLAEPVPGVELENTHAEFGPIFGEGLTNLPDDQLATIRLRGPAGDRTTVPLVWVVTLPKGAPVKLPFQLEFGRPGRLTCDLVWEPGSAPGEGAFLLRGQYYGPSGPDRIAWTDVDFTLPESLAGAGLVPRSELDVREQIAPDAEGRFEVRHRLKLQPFAGKQSIPVSLKFWGTGAHNTDYRWTYRKDLVVEGGEPGVVEVATVPEGLDVFWQNQWQGQTPLRLELPAGEQVLLLSTPRERLGEVKVQVMAGQTLQVRPPLAAPVPPTPPETGSVVLAPGYEVSWQASFDGSALLWALLDQYSGNSSSRPARLTTFADGLVFVPNGRELVALDEQTGQVRWRAPLDVGHGEHSLRVAYGLALVSDEAGVRALDLASGQETWSVSANYVDLGPVSDGRVFVNSSKGFRAFEVLSGNQAWIRDDPQAEGIEGPPVLVGGHLVGRARRSGTKSDWRLLEFDRKNGETRWSADVGPGVEQLVPGAALVIAVTDQGTLSAWRPGEPASVWRFAEREGRMPLVEAAEGRVVAAWPDGEVKAFDERTGEVLWSTNLEAEIGALFAGGGFCFVAQTEGVLQVLRASDGRHLYERPLPGRTSKLFASPRRVFAEAGSLLVAFGKEEGR